MIHVLVAAAICVLDQILKYWVTVNVPFRGQMKLIDGVIHLTYVKNTGAAFSIFSEHTWLLAAISIIGSVVVLVFILRKGLSFWEKLSLGLVLGGAVGNAIDRIVLGYVVDMFETEFVTFAVFNVADAFIDIGVVLFAILYIVRISREEKKIGTIPELDRLKKNAIGTEDPEKTEDETGEN